MADLAPLVRTAGEHSFPSSHATSAAAAVVALGALRPAGSALPALAAAVCVSRIVVGVHYPTDVVAGAALGALAARAGAGWMHAAVSASPGGPMAEHTTLLEEQPPRPGGPVTPPTASSRQSRWVACRWACCAPPVRASGSRTCSWSPRPPQRATSSPATR